MNYTNTSSGVMPDERLLTAVSLLNGCRRIADVGCDHGRLGVYMLEHGLADSVWMMDISEPSLKKARNLVRLCGLNEKVRFLVTDGVKELPEPVDGIVIAGMGGATICGILRAGKENLRGAKLILQANVGVPELRACVAEIGYRITDERIVREDRRHYVLLCAEPGEAMYDEKDLIVGPLLRTTRPALLESYADFRLRVVGKALAGAEKGNDADGIKILRSETEIWKEVKAWFAP